MKVIVYVEGPSDRLAMQELLASLLARLRQAGVSVDFLPTDNKQRLMIQTPIKAVNILRNDPQAVVVAMPDLYPRNQGLPHTTYDDLAHALQRDFSRAMTRNGVDDPRLAQRFKVFCFKYDLEALVLAAEAPLASRLGATSVQRTWTVPVEDQDHNTPPKRIVERLFKEANDTYRDTIDAPLILGAAHYPDIAAACPQCFKPFVDFLDSILAQHA